MVNLSTETFRRQCRRCGAEFETDCRIKRRCNACQKTVQAAKNEKWNERKRQARREARAAR